LTRKLDLVHKEWSPGKVERNIDKGFVKRYAVGGEAPNTCFVAESNRKRVAKSDANIFNSVVSIDLEIAFGFNDEIETSVTTKLGEHVIKERNACRCLVAPLTIEIDLDED
jgi:hypothetical protein